MLATVLALAPLVAADELQTPPLQLPVPPALAAQGRLQVRAFAFTGNTAFSDSELAAVTAPFTGRELTAEDLEDARRAVTLHYVNRGYVNSGAVLGAQKIVDGVVNLAIVEGRLTEVALTGNRWLRDSYLTGRVRRQAGTPVNLIGLQNGLQRLRQNPNVVQVNADLQPGALPGESRLDLRVLDRHPFRLGLQVDNERPPGVGSVQVLALAADRNLTGHSDSLELVYGIAHGSSHDFEWSELDNLEGSYSLPLNSVDTTLLVHGEKKDYTVVEDPFAALDIESESHTYGAWLRQPIYRTANRELALSIGFDRRESETTLLGLPFNISPGAVDGEMNLSVLRVAKEWVDRGLNQVIAFRSTVSIGIDAFGTTDDGTGRDAKFVTWLGQAQYVRRLFRSPALLILRVDGQWTDDQLLSLEQFSVGGVNSVRGYRENQLVRDRGVCGSIEVRVPVLRNRQGLPIVQIAPFIDGGGAWNVDGAGGPDTILSAGLGVLVTPNRHAYGQLYWGHAFRDFDTAEDDPQDLGLHFRVTLNAF